MIQSNATPTITPHPSRGGVIGGVPKRFKQRANLVSYKQDLERTIPNWINNTYSSNDIFTSMADGGWWPTNGAPLTNMLPRWTVTGLLDHVGAPTNYLDVTPWFNLHKVSNGWAYMRPLVSNLYVSFSRDTSVGGSVGQFDPGPISRPDAVDGVVTGKTINSPFLESNAWALTKTLFIANVETNPAYGLTNPATANDLPWLINFRAITNNNPISVQPIKMSAPVGSKFGYNQALHIWNQRPHYGRTYAAFDGKVTSGSPATHYDYFDWFGIAPTSDVAYLLQDTGTQTTNEVRTAFNYTYTPWEGIPASPAKYDLRQEMKWILHVQHYDMHYGP